jgi:hypothetical protein
MKISRCDVLELFGVGGVVFASGLWGCGRAGAGASASAAPTSAAGSRDFFFLQLSDTHWGYEGPANPESKACLRKAVAAINASPAQPDFVVFTGDLTHTTNDAGARRARFAEFRAIVGELRVKRLVFLPGEHDAPDDHGAAYREAFGDPTTAFEHEGVHFVTLDNATSFGSAIGDAGLAFLERAVERVPAGSPLVVFAHRPLFDLAPDWDWHTSDGARAIAILSRHDRVTVFYGHVHQEHHATTGAIAHHAARSLIFPLPAPSSVERKAPLPWDPASADHGLGYRAVEHAPRTSARARVRERRYPFAGPE